MKYQKMGDYLKYEFLDKFGITQSGLALALMVHGNRIGEIVRNRRGVSADTDLRLCRFFKLEKGHFLAVQNEMELKEAARKMGKDLEKIPIFDTFENKWG